MTEEFPMAAKPIPDGYHTITPYLTVNDAAKVIQFLKQGLGAEVAHEPFKRPDGKVAHAEVKIGDSRVMLGEENEMAKASPSTLYVYVADVDASYQLSVVRCFATA
jgi:PhnB protein